MPLPSCQSHTLGNTALAAGLRIERLRRPHTLPDLQQTTCVSARVRRRRQVVQPAAIIAFVRRHEVQIWGMLKTPQQVAVYSVYTEG